ncbi:hypothetical protein EIP91_011013 [Steccherinum ochraceum]|uniref:Cytosol aminopeptidase domain-containing protein n=1 Tax=Steccherinum ochraceum TaxID=92696 RepID=A0A4R0R581_9APHY|nr:hypothetical protein EIP91_011013 [Steccherinum ochraceum]
MTIFLLPIDPSTSTPVKLNAQATNVDVWNTVPNDGTAAPTGTAHLFFALPNAGDVLVLSSLGPDYAKTTGNPRRERVRVAVGSAVKKLKTLGKAIWGSSVSVDASEDPHAAAVGAHLSMYNFDLKTDPASLYKGYRGADITGRLSFAPLVTAKEWDDGVTYAAAQNVARTLKELPANVMTPTKFAHCIVNLLHDVPNDVYEDEVTIQHKSSRIRFKQAKTSGFPNTEVHIHNEGMCFFSFAVDLRISTWILDYRLGVQARYGTSQPAKFVEMIYQGTDDTTMQPIVLVGEGITFDSGGISLKPADNMKLRRGDLGGAAAVLATLVAVATMEMKVHLRVIMPLCENMPGRSASKPGNIMYAMNGKSVEVATTDAAGRLVLADALWYGSTLTPKPKAVIDVATSNGSTDKALGGVYTGVFTNSDKLWKSLDDAGAKEHDRLWRLPLCDDFAPQITEGNADLANTGGSSADPCTNALFLKSFVSGVDDETDPTPWAHLDIAGTMQATRAGAYQEVGMTGRATRALIEYVRGQAVA